MVPARLFLVSLGWWIQNVDSFMIEIGPRYPSRTNINRPCYSTASDDDNLDSLRQMLESAWDAPTMGFVPTDPESAANAAASSLLSAIEQHQQLKQLDRNGIFFIHLLLPQYDCTAGSQIYDEIVAAEFCVALAQNLEERKTQIIVRDAKVLSNIQRVLDARERYFEQNEEEDDDDQNQIEETPEDMQNFRAKLMSSWDSNSDSEESPSTTKDKLANDLGPLEAVSSHKTQSTTLRFKKFRLTSMLGDTTAFCSGPNMMKQVMQAVSANALAQSDEDTIVVLNTSQSKEEMIAIRALAAKYRSSGKTMVLVNCQLDPLPNELADGVTAYSIQPLIGKLKGVARDGTTTVEPRVVILRRFPRDWEMYVDDSTGEGFSLAATVSPSKLPDPIKGPTIDWVVRNLERFLQMKAS